MGRGRGVSKVHVLTVITEDYVDRARAFLTSLAGVLSATKLWCVCLGFSPTQLVYLYRHVTFCEMLSAPSDSHGMCQNGRWLDCLDGVGAEDVIVQSDADVLVQRDFLSEELERLRGYNGYTFGAGPNCGVDDTLFKEAERIRLTDLESYGGVDVLEQIPCFNFGVLAARVCAWWKLRTLYEATSYEFYLRCNHRSRCQWLGCWCLERGFRVDVLPGSFHSHGHFGIPPGISWDKDRLALYKGVPVMFRHALQR